MNRWMVMALVAALLLATAGVVVARMLGRRAHAMVFHPTRLSAGTVAALAARPGWQLDRLRTDDGVELVGLVRGSTLPDHRTVLFFGGNAYDLAGSQSILEGLAATSPRDAYAVYAYRGYDGSGGTPSELALISDAKTIAAHLSGSFGIDPARLLLVGQSLGTAVATRLAVDLSAAGTPPAKLLLLSPFRSIAEVIRSHVPVPIHWGDRDRFATEEIIGSLRLPILIIHGTADGLIPIAHAEALAIKSPTITLRPIAGRGHDDLWVDPATLPAVTAFLAAER